MALMLELAVLLLQYTEDFDRVRDCLPRLAALIHRCVLTVC